MGWIMLILFVGCTTTSKESSDSLAQKELLLPDILSELAAEVDEMPLHECETDQDCAKKAKEGEKLACNCEHKCIPAQCFEDKNCGLGSKYCDPCLKQCMPKKPACAPCSADYECEGDLSRCVSEFTINGVTTVAPFRFCAQWCPLPNGACVIEGAPLYSYVCAKIGDPKNGVCVPKDMDCGKAPKKCSSDADCKGKKEKCFSDLGICGCMDSTACGLEEACNPVTHQCVPGCKEDNECGQGLICNQKQCQPACKKDAQGNVEGCPDQPPKPGKVWDCDEKGHCYVPGMCFSPFDCHEKETYCDPETNECKPGCLTDFDCKQSMKKCENGVCIDKGCSGNWECGCGQVCDLSTNKCKTAEGKYCEPCDQQQGENACGNKEILCIGFKDPETNEDKGSYCMPPCGPDPENPCPQGWQCQEIKDDQGKSYGKKCIRFCYHKVEGCAI